MGNGSRDIMPADLPCSDSVVGAKYCGREICGEIRCLHIGCSLLTAMWWGQQDDTCHLSHILFTPLILLSHRKTTMQIYALVLVVSSSTIVDALS